MSKENPPYLNAYGNITKTLNKIKSAQTPPRFTQDFLQTTLSIKGGAGKPMIPFLKRTGLIGSDGVPTERYKQFRNSDKTGMAAAEALQEGYHSLYKVNEYVHNASDKALGGIVVQVTGLEPDSRTTKAIIGSFNALKEFANFDVNDDTQNDNDDDTPDSDEIDRGGDQVVLKNGLGLSYNINLNLPATSDIKVFDAIFKSLKEHLLK